jgi:Holliday junction resolvase RusA-like endonuclease
MAGRGRDDGTADGLTLTLPPPTMPGANSRCHWRVRHKAARHDRYVAATLALAEMRKSASWQRMEGASLTVTWRGRGRLPDPDNIGGRTKAYIDGLTDAGVWADDSVVRSITFRTERAERMCDRCVIIEARRT